jgi:hypothetical protein
MTEDEIDELTWNATIDTAIKEVVMQSLAIPPHVYPKEYAAACMDCARRLARLREPRPTDQQVAVTVIGFLTEATLPQSVLDERAIEAHNARCEEFLIADRKKKDPNNAG